MIHSWSNIFRRCPFFFYNLKVDFSLLWSRLNYILCLKGKDIMTHFWRWSRGFTVSWLSVLSLYIFESKMELTARYTECFFWPQANRLDREQSWIIKVSYFLGHSIINCSKLMGVERKMNTLLRAFSWGITLDSMWNNNTVISKEAACFQF